MVDLLRDSPILYKFDKCLVFEGEGSVTTDRTVIDNRWHLLEWSRKYQEISLVLDGTERSESTTPGKERLLNIARKEEIFVNINSPDTEGKCSKLPLAEGQHHTTLYHIVKKGSTILYNR